MNTEMLSSQGTAIDEAIRLSSTYFDQDQSTERLLFIVSDGEDHNDLSYEMAELAAKNNITIYSIGVGTEKGSPIPIKKNGIVMNYKKDSNNEVVITKLNKIHLENISEKTGGKFINGSVTEDVINEVIQILENTEKKEFDTQKFSDFEDQFQWFIFIGFVFVVLDTFMKDGKTIWLKNLNLFNEK